MAHLASSKTALIYESYLATLAILKIVRDPVLVPGHKTLLGLLVRDSVIYFIFVVSLVAVNAIVFAFQPTMPGVAISSLVDAASSIGGTRMIISLRKAAWSPPDLPTVSIHQDERTHDNNENREPNLEQQIDRPLRTAISSIDDTFHGGVELAEL